MKQEIIYTDNMCPKKGIPSLPNESIHLTFTSPPYYNYIEYNENTGIGHKNSTYKEYLSALKETFQVIWKKTIPGGRVIIIYANMKSRKAIEGTSYMMYPITHHITKIMSKIGYLFYDEIIWHKFKNRTPNNKPLFGSYPYPPTPRIMDSSFENILIFTKKGKRSVEKTIKEQSKLTLEEWREFTKGIWNINNPPDALHPATFPFELAERIIRLYSFVEDTILDPFAGSGTSLIACEKWNRNGIGYEIAKSYKTAYENRRLKYIGQLELL